MVAQAYGDPAIDQGAPLDISKARTLLETVATRYPDGPPRATFMATIRTEIAIAEAEDEIARIGAHDVWDPVFRLKTRRWGLDEDTLHDMIPVRRPSLRLLPFDFDVSAFREVQTIADLPEELPRGPSTIAVTGPRAADRPPLLIDRRSATILQLCDGERTVDAIIAALGTTSSVSDVKNERDWIEDLFRIGLIGLRDGRTACTA